jgi:hypothetical protein
MTDLQRLHDLPLDLARRVKYGAAILGMPGQRRHLFRWLRSAGPSYLLEEPSPWMTFDAIQVLDDHLRPGMRVFEYGSGGSTLFWAKKEATVVSVEHDPLWFGSVHDRLKSSSAVDYRLVEPEPGVLASDGAPGDPLAYASDDERFRGSNFKRYVSQIDQFPEASFDLVSIDGRARPSCIMHAAPKVKPGGILVLDNAERPYYLERTRRFIAVFEERVYPGVLPSTRHVSQTNIYRRLPPREDR